ncbi:MAG: hypothetical protein AAF411_18260, partial [Myxococcota bacterium]
MRFDVWLLELSVDGGAKALATAFNLDLQEARTLELTVPTCVGRNLDEPRAARAVRMLRGIGGKAEARLADPEAPFGFELAIPNERESVEPGEAEDAKGPADKESESSIAPEAKRAGIGEALEDELPDREEPYVDRRPLTDPPRPGSHQGALDLRPRGSRPAPTPALDLNKPVMIDVVDIGPPPSKTREPRPSAAVAPGPSIFERLGPALVALLVGGAALWGTLRRGRSAFLGNGDTIGWLLDGLTLVSAAMAVLFTAVAFSDRRRVDLAPSLALVLVGVGAAYGLDRWRAATPG